MSVKFVMLAMLARCCPRSRTLPLSLVTPQFRTAPASRVAPQSRVALRQMSRPLLESPRLLGGARLLGNPTLQGNPTLLGNPPLPTSPTSLGNPTLQENPTLLGNPTLPGSPASLRLRPLARLASETMLDRLLMRLAAVQPLPPLPAAMFACRGAAARNTSRRLRRRAGRETPTATGADGWVGDALLSARRRVGFLPTGRASVSCGSTLDSRKFQSEP
jgi:hypothetical protein